MTAVLHVVSASGDCAVRLASALAIGRPAEAGPGDGAGRADSDRKLHAADRRPRQGLFQRREPDRHLGAGRRKARCRSRRCLAAAPKSAAAPFSSRWWRAATGSISCSWRPAPRSGKQPPDNSALLVRADDTIRTPAQLAGKKISAGLLNSVNYVHMREWLQKKGVDASKIEFLEIPFPQMADALFQKRVDAVWNVEPFVTFMIEVRQGAAHGLSVSGQHAGHGHLQLFRQGKLGDAPIPTSRAASSARSTAPRSVMATAPKEERDEWVAKFTGMKLEVVKEVTLPVYSTEFNVPSLQ